MSNATQIDAYMNDAKTKKKTGNYSLVISVATHLLVMGAVKYGYLFSLNTTAPVQESYVDLGYETFDEAPIPPPAVVKSEEIQDEKSEVVGLQKKVETPSVAPATTATTTYADVPYYKIKPKYPKDALEAGLEGHVNMSIDILEDGSVDNVKVTGGENLNSFESAAMRAVAKYKYKPFTDAAGNPIKKTNHLVKVDFILKDELSSTN
jgi:TonB family protein